MRALTHREFLETRRFPAIDGLRAVGALLVVDFHFDHKWPWLQGWVGVHIFFVVSGFLITTLLLREESVRGKVSLRSFCLRRVFRIMPVYFVVLALMSVVSWRNGRFAEMRPAMGYYLTFFNEKAPPTWFVHSWTLGIEQKFYLLWPLVAFSVAAVARFRFPLTAALFGLGFVVSVASSPSFGIDISSLEYIGGQTVHYTGLLVGCLLAVTMHSPRGFAAMRFLTIPWVGVVAVAVFVGAHLSLTPALPRFGAAPSIAVYDLAVAVMLPSLLRSGVFTWLLSTRPMTFIGERSYSLYLIQALAGTAAIGVLPTYASGGKTLTIAAAVASLCAADLLYRWVEMPMIHFGRRFTRRPSDTDQTGDTGQTSDTVTAHGWRAARTAVLSTSAR